MKREMRRPRCHAQIDKPVIFNVFMETTKAAMEMSSFTISSVTD
jgi:hypothetical protein